MRAPFRIAAAQIPSIRGDIAANISAHIAAMMAAAAQGVAVLVFPELSLTGYEPDLAAKLAIAPQDNRLKPLVELAREHHIEAIVGAPLLSGSAKPAIGAIVFTPSGKTGTYWKMHLGGSEPDYFVPGNAPLVLAGGGHKIGLAICADASQSSHPEAYRDLGADIYAAGVFLNAEWYATDVPRLAHYAARFKLLTVMSNHAASFGTHQSVGRSAIWAPGGELLAQAEANESALVIATETHGTWQGEIHRM